MKKSFYLFVLILIGISVSSYAQSSEKIKIYNPDANAELDLKNAIIQASESGKHIFIQIGGNWCPWCVKFHNYIEEYQELDSLLKANYIVLKINHSREQKNEAILEQFKFPQRFGFPVFVILNSKGDLLHTQDSGYLEKDKSYDKNKVTRFFKNWSSPALDPKSYKKKQ